MARERLDRVTLEETTKRSERNQSWKSPISLETLENVGEYPRKSLSNVETRICTEAGCISSARGSRHATEGSAEMSSRRIPATFNDCNPLFLDGRAVSHARGHRLRHSVAFQPLCTLPYDRFKFSCNCRDILFPWFNACRMRMARRVWMGGWSLSWVVRPIDIGQWVDCWSGWVIIARKGKRKSWKCFVCTFSRHLEGAWYLPGWMC